MRLFRSFPEQRGDLLAQPAPARVGFEALVPVRGGKPVPLGEIAVIGDGLNDVAMFAQCPFSIAMGNASDEVKAKARFVTESNEEDGFARAVERYLLAPDRGGAT